MILFSKRENYFFTHIDINVVNIILGNEKFFLRGNIIMI